MFLSIPFNSSVITQFLAASSYEGHLKMSITLVIPRHIHCLSGRSEPGRKLCTWQVHPVVSFKLFQSDITFFSSWISSSGSGITLDCVFCHSIQVTQAISVLNLKHDLISSLELKFSNILSSALVQSQTVLNETSSCPFCF